MSSGFMRIACSLGSLLSIQEVQECARILSGTDVEAVWIPETWGMENFSMLGAVSAKTGNQKIGSSVINIYSRSPSLVAMGAATVDALSGGRLILGLGTSSVPIVETFHGYRFERPLQRMREYVEIIRLVLSGGQANYSGKIFNLRNFSLLITPKRTSIPIYLAAVNKGMVDLAWEIADGVIFYLRPIRELKETISGMQSRNRIDAACQIITCVSHDAEAAACRARRTLAFYVSVGEVYRKFLAENGFKSETENIFDEFKRTGFKSNHELVTDQMLRSLVIAGTPEECKRQLRNFRETGLDLPIIQFNPVGDTMESLDLLARTLLED